MSLLINCFEGKMLMANYRLVQVAPDCRCKEIAYSQNIVQLIEISTDVKNKYPEMEYAIVDERGYFIWPDDLKEP